MPQHLERNAAPGRVWPRDGASFVKAPQDFAAGIVLAAVAALVFWATWNLDLGQLNLLGPGFVPKVFAGLLAVLAVLILAQSFVAGGEGVEPVAWRGPLLVTASIVAFAVTLRPFGLFTAGVLICFLGGLAARDVRIKGLIVYSLVASFLACLVFKYLFGMQVPTIAFPDLGQF